MYVLDGDFDYFFKEIDSDDISYLRVKKGETIFTPPMEIHACYFPSETRLIVSSKNPRDKETYEADTVRVELINDENIDFMLATYAKN